MSFVNRIVERGVKPADQFLPHPDNPRIHPPAQRRAVGASLREFGVLKPILVNRRPDGTEVVIDGHERIWQALESNSDMPYDVVELSENEERQVLLTLDYMVGMADYDRDAVSRLLDEVNTTNADMMQLLADIAEMEGVVPPDPFEEDRPPVDRTVECPACGERFEG